MNRITVVKQKDYKFSICIDFFDDLINTSFDKEYLEKLFKLFKSWGIKRIYWIYLLKHNERLHSCVPYQGLTDNLETTYKNIGEFLPAAVRIAHKLNMELYAVYKVNDLAYHSTFPFKSEESLRYGKVDSLSGKMCWAANGLVNLQHMRMERKMNDVPGDIGKRIIKRIKLVSNSRKRTGIKKGNLRIFISDDNNAYHKYITPFNLIEKIEKNKRVLTIDNLNIKSKYFSINTLSGDNKGTLKNSLAKLVEIYDTKGEILPFTYGLISRKDYYDMFKIKKIKISKDIIKKGYIFNWDNNANYSGFLKETTSSIDNNRGYIAFVKGKERYVTGILSPAYKEVQNYWLRHIRECLEAGVDGIDLRSVSHTRNFEWENYGFEKPIVREYKKRYKKNILKEPFDDEKRLDIIAGYYTDFFKKAAKLIRKAKKKVQIHIGGVGIYQGTRRKREWGKFSTGRKWEWGKWIKEGLADEITLKGAGAFDRKSYNMIYKLSSKYNIPVYYCSYMKGINSRQLEEILTKSKKWKQDGFIIYESAMILEELKNGRIKLLSPDIPKIIENYAS